MGVKFIENQALLFYFPIWGLGYGMDNRYSIPRTDTNFALSHSSNSTSEPVIPATESAPGDGGGGYNEQRREAEISSSKPRCYFHLSVMNTDSIFAFNRLNILFLLV